MTKIIVLQEQKFQQPWYTCKSIIFFAFTLLTTLTHVINTYPYLADIFCRFHRRPGIFVTPNKGNPAANVESYYTGYMEFTGLHVISNRSRFQDFILTQPASDSPFNIICTIAHRRKVILEFFTGFPQIESPLSITGFEVSIREN